MELGNNLVYCGMKEEWRDVKNYKGYYQVSNLGRIKSLDRYVKHNSGGFRLYKGAVMNPTIDVSGYKMLSLWREGKTERRTLHSLIAESFLEHKRGGNKLVVDHIDNDKLNNKVSNLQIVSHRVNSTKDKIGGTSKYLGVSLDKSRSKWRAYIYLEGKNKFLGYFNCELAASRAYNKELNKIS